MARSWARERHPRKLTDRPGRFVPRARPEYGRGTCHNVYIMAEEVIPSDHIQTRIFALRGHRFIVDTDLAAFYGVTAGVLNQAVKRNAFRFPSDFRFQLTDQEIARLRSQFVISNGRGGRRYLPFAFTEHGALMAATVLNSVRAVEMSILIVRAFASMRRMAAAHSELAEKLAELEARIGGHDADIEAIVEAIRQLTAPMGEEHDRKIGFHAGNR